MVEFILNGTETVYEGDPSKPLLAYLRGDAGITSVKDGCSGQAACGACMVEINGKATLSCVTEMEKVAGKTITSIEGFPEKVRSILGKAFVKSGAVQCGFCTPGLLTRTKVLLEENPSPTREQIIIALRCNFCRCTGYHKIINAVALAAEALREGREIALDKPGRVGTGQPKYGAYQRAIGKSPFVDDLCSEGMLYGALRYSDHPRARVLSIDRCKAEAVPGVVRIFTAEDIPGERYNGLVYADWPLFIARGEITRYIGDVIAGVVAREQAAARKAAALIEIKYEVLEPLTELLQAEDSPIKVHDRDNLLGNCIIRRGEDIDTALAKALHTAEGTFMTQRIEHAFLETEAALAEVCGDCESLHLFSQSQGVYEDRRQIARLLALPEGKVRVTLIPNGGGFGGKEDLSVQGHASLYAWLLGKPVKLSLTREESIRMHPKRHPIHMEMKMGCDAEGKLLGMRARIIGDTGAYASVGTKVLERAAGHATGAYHFPAVDLEAKTVYTNNIPCGAMRGFGVNQATWALETLMEELCEKGGFDSWQFRFDNALENGGMTSTGQILESGVGVRATLLAIKEEYDTAEFKGLACGIKNCGVGNGMVDESTVKIEIRSADDVVLHHGWTEMGQGVDTVALQTLVEETGIDPDSITVTVDTEFSARAGMTTSSRGTSLVGNSTIEASRSLKEDLKTKTLADLAGKTYEGKWVCDWTTKPGAPGKVITHYSYSYATQLVILNKKGEIKKVVAAHDAGKVMNSTLFEGQIQGCVHMGLGYALTEDLPMERGFLKSTRMRDLGILPIDKTPPVEVIAVEVKDPYGPYGAKGVGEIGMVPTAGAVANAYFRFDGQRRYSLPLFPKGK